MRVLLSDISFEPIACDDPYVSRLLRWADVDAEITFGWRVFVRGEPLGMVWVEMCGAYGLIHGLCPVSGRYIPFVSVAAFRLAESAVKSIGLIPSVFYPKDLLHVKRLCDIVGYRRVIYNDGENIEVIYGEKIE